MLFPDRPAGRAPIAVLNPLASQLDVMRTTLAGGLLGVLTGNLARKHERVRVFGEDQQHQPRVVAADLSVAFDRDGPALLAA